MRLFNNIRLVSEMTYTVSSGTLNSSIPYLNNIRHNPLHILHPLLPKQTTVTALGPDLIILNVTHNLPLTIKQFRRLLKSFLFSSY